MSNRIYNILFHTHTISGIVISAALYIIFFAGSFSFFRDEIISWERNEPTVENRLDQIDLNLMLDTLDQRYELYGKDVDFTKYFQERRISVSLSATKDTTVKKGGRGTFFYMHATDMDSYSYADNYSIGELLYRLHFFAQLNFFGRSGYILSGLVAFFFLFAIITGILVHWKKIISNFYLFRPKEKLKNLWTDAHTALGVIGLPFQFVFAVTGVFLIAGSIIMAPPVLSILYDGNQAKMYEELIPKRQEFAFVGVKQENDIDLNAFVDKAYAYWDDFEIRNVKIYNYGDANMHVGVIGHPDYNAKFTGEGELIFNATSGEIIYEKDPFANSSYFEGATGVMDRLHFGDFGGVGLKIVYFILGLVSCFVIISGVLIWLVARDKKHVAERKRKFNAWVGWIYLAGCLGMYPVTAFTFVAVKLFLHDFNPGRMTDIYHIFFYSWLVVTVLFVVKRDNYFTNKFSLISGSVLGFMVPLANGFVTGNWPWVTFAKGYYNIFFIDVFWLVLSIITLVVALKLKRKKAFVAPAKHFGKKSIAQKVTVNV